MCYGWPAVLAAPCAGDSEMPFSSIHCFQSPQCSRAVFAGFSPSCPSQTSAVSQGRWRRRKAGDYAPTTIGACVAWGRLHCLCPSSPFLWPQGCGKQSRERKGSTPSSHRQCSCPCTRHQLASYSVQRWLLDAVHPLWTAWSLCNCRQLDRDVCKAVECSPACWHEKRG